MCKNFINEQVFVWQYVSKNGEKKEKHKRKM